jgi:hypothetical protein
MSDTRVAIDIQELGNQAILDALLNEKGEVFKTARGRRAILIGTAALSRLSRSMHLRLEEDPDGNQILKA